MFWQLLKQSHHQLARISSLLLIITHCSMSHEEMRWPLKNTSTFKSQRPSYCQRLKINLCLNGGQIKRSVFWNLEWFLRKTFLHALWQSKIWAHPIFLDSLAFRSSRGFTRFEVLLNNGSCSTLMHSPK